LKHGVPLWGKSFNGSLVGGWLARSLALRHHFELILLNEFNGVCSQNSSRVIPFFESAAAKATFKILQILKRSFHEKKTLT
jgi:hypothetical protein